MSASGSRKRPPTRPSGFARLRTTVACLGVLTAVVVGSIAWASNRDPSVVRASQVHLDRSRGLFLVDSTPYTGTATSRFDNGFIERIDTYTAGKRDGQRLHYHPNGVLAQHAHYSEGRLDGQNTTWFETGSRRSDGHWQNGVAEGLHRQWYRSGALFKERRLVHGKEHGMQRAWRENGAIYNNYEAHKGRIYGLRRSKLCVDLDDEEVHGAR